MTLRIVRIVPPYWFFTTLVAVLLVAAPGAFDRVRFDPPHLLASYLFVPHIARTGGDAPTLLSGWTLNYEMYFYAVFALSLSLRARAGLVLLTAYFVGSVALGSVLPARVPFPLAYWTRPIVLEFLLGVLIGHAHLAGWRPRPPLAALLGLVALAGLALPHETGLSSAEWRALDYGLPAGLLGRPARSGPGSRPGARSPAGWWRSATPPTSCTSGTRSRSASRRPRGGVGVSATTCPRSPTCRSRWSPRSWWPSSSTPPWKRRCTPSSRRAPWAVRRGATAHDERWRPLIR